MLACVRACVRALTTGRSAQLNGAARKARGVEEASFPRISIIRLYTVIRHSIVVLDASVLMRVCLCVSVLMFTLRMACVHACVHREAVVSEVGVVGGG